MIKIKQMPTSGLADTPVDAPFGLDFYLDKATFNVRLVITADGQKKIQIREIEGDVLTIEASSSNQVYIL